MTGAEDLARAARMITRTALSAPARRISAFSASIIAIDSAFGGGEFSVQPQDPVCLLDDQRARRAIGFQDTRLPWVPPI